MNSNKVLKFELTVDEVNWILGALQEIPAKHCNPITNKLQQQAQPQLAEKEEKEED